MAYGLRCLVNGGYIPYGNGRDWFFIGDFEYQNGRRTPDPNLRQRLGTVKPPMQAKKPPMEVSMNRTMPRSSRHDFVAPRTLDKWKRHHDAATYNDVIQEKLRAVGVNPDVPRWRNSEALLPRLPSGKYAKLRKAPSAPAVAGDKASWCSTSYSEFGQSRDWVRQEFGSPDKHHYHSNVLCYPPDRYPASTS